MWSISISFDTVKGYSLPWSPTIILIGLKHYLDILISMRRAYCTNCKHEVEIRSFNYVRLVNLRVAVEGSCPVCNSVLFNTRVMPTSSRKPISRKKKRKKLSIYSQMYWTAWWLFRFNSRISLFRVLRGLYDPTFGSRLMNIRTILNTSTKRDPIQHRKLIRLFMGHA